MIAVVSDRVMAKKTATLPVKLPADVIESGRIVAALSGVTMMDLFGDILRPTLAKMERELLAQRSKEVGVGETDDPESPAKGRKAK